jgi:hypothetical protein
MLDLDVHLRRRIVWRLVLDAYCLECIVERLPKDQLGVMRILETAVSCMSSTCGARISSRL